MISSECRDEDCYREMDVDNFRWGQLAEECRKPITRIGTEKYISCIKHCKNGPCRVLKVGHGQPATTQVDTSVSI